MNQTRPQFASARTASFQGAGLLGHILGLVIFLAIVALLIFLILPLGILLFVLGLIAYGIYRIKRAFRRAHEPNGSLDGRRNVRVVQRDE
jgi:flagellar biogenesis protein FliO